MLNDFCQKGSGNGITQMVTELRLLKFAWPKKVCLYKHQVGWVDTICFGVLLLFVFLFGGGQGCGGKPKACFDFFLVN